MLLPLLIAVGVESALLLCALPLLLLCARRARKQRAVAPGAANARARPKCTICIGRNVTATDHGPRNCPHRVAGQG